MKPAATVTKLQPGSTSSSRKRSSADMTEGCSIWKLLFNMSRNAKP